MATKALALIESSPLSLVDLARSSIVLGCAFALIFAGRALPF
jgi:hypothetical protein